MVDNEKNPEYETEAASGVVVMESVSVVGDSLVGNAINLRRGPLDDFEPRERLGIARANITQIEERQREFSVLAVLGGLAAAVGLVFLVKGIDFYDPE